MNYSIRKYVCKAVLAGFIISLLPVSISANVPPQPFTKERTVKFSSLSTLNEPFRLSRKKIDWYLKEIRKTSNFFSNISWIIKKAVKKIAKSDFYTVGSVVFDAVSFIILMTTGIIGVSQPVLFVIAGGVHLLLLPSYLLSFGLTTSTLSALLAMVYGGSLTFSLLYMKRLETEEERFPGTLTSSDLNTIKIFKNVLKGPITRAIIKGKQLKRIRKRIVKNFINGNKDFYIRKASEKRATKDIDKYIIVKARIPSLQKVLYPLNLNITWHNYLKYMDIKVTWKIIDEYKKNKELLNQDGRNQLMKNQIDEMMLLYNKMHIVEKGWKRLTPGYIALNVKETALKVNPAYVLTEKALKDDKKFIKKLNAKYGKELKDKLKKSVKDYKKKMAKVISELSVIR